MKKELTPSIKRHIKGTEPMMIKILGHSLRDEMDLIRAIIDGTDGDPEIREFFCGKDLGNSYLIQERWAEAYSAIYYVEALDYNFNLLKRGNPPRMFMLPYLDEAARAQFFAQDPKEIYRAFKDSPPRALYFYYTKPFAPEPVQFEERVQGALAAWKARIEIEKNKYAWAKRPDQKLACAYEPFNQYVHLLLLTGQMEPIEPAMQEYLRWLEWYQAKKTKPDYRGALDMGTIRASIFLPFFDCWMRARRLPEEREELAGLAQRELYKWFHEGRVAARGRDGLAIEVLLSMVMRIDLGLDLETCREFARYFKPYLDIFPHIREKVQALGVEWEPRPVLPFEELKRLRPQIRIELGRDPETGCRIRP